MVNLGVPLNFKHDAGLIGQALEMGKKSKCGKKNHLEQLQVNYAAKLNFRCT